MESLRDSNLGLPLTWVKEQGAGFRAYLLQNPEAEFNFRGATYRVEFADALIYSQGFAAVVDRMKAFVGINMLADIGMARLQTRRVCKSASRTAPVELQIRATRHA